MNTFFQNHETVKLALHSPLLSVIVIYGGIILLIISTAKRNNFRSAFLDRTLTDQLRGLAILLVVTGHIGIHVLDRSSSHIFPVLGNYGVSLFFVLSGFGLTMSSQNRPFMLGDFIKRRLMKVMVPYWIITFCILIADHFLLHQNRTPTDILMTFLGFNTNEATRTIDYVRWYVTVLIIWYCLFAILELTVRTIKIKALLVNIFGFCLLLFSYYIVPIGYAYFSFPFGVIIGLYHKQISSYIRHISSRNILILIAILFASTYFIKHYLFTLLLGNIPGIILSLISELSLLIFSAASILFVGVLHRYKSDFLYLCGYLSYSIFLLHTIFMIKYDLFLFRWPLFLSFWPYLVFLLTVSWAATLFFNGLLQPARWKALTAS